LFGEDAKNQGFYERSGSEPHTRGLGLIGGSWCEDRPQLRINLNFMRPNVYGWINLVVMTAFHLNNDDLAVNL
jgi:hypothetical protein